MVSCLLLLNAAIAQAYEPGTHRAANTLAMGFTGVANPEDNVAITKNPAMMSLRRRFDFDAQFAYGDHPHVGWGGSAVDSESTRTAFGLAYRRLASEPPFETPELPGWAPPGDLPSNEKRFNEFTGGFAVPGFGRRASFGLNGTVSIANHDRGGKGTTGNFDAGLGFEPVTGLLFGVTAHDVIPDQSELDHPFGVAGGVRVEDVRAGAVEFNANYLLDDARDGPIELAGGGELKANTVRLRGGWAWRQNDHWITGGLGAENEAGAVEYGIAVPSRANDPFDLMHMVSVRVFGQGNK